MRWKIFTYIAALMLVLTTSASPIKVAAQGLVEYALILVVVGVGEGETAEIYWRLQEPSQAISQDPIFAPPVVTWTIDVTNAGDGTCTQTLLAPVAATTGLMKIFKVSKSGLLLLIDGGDGVGILEKELDDCFGYARIALQVGVLAPADMVERLAADPDAATAGLGRRLTVFGLSIVNSNGETAATGTYQPPYYGYRGYYGY